MKCLDLTCNGTVRSWQDSNICCNKCLNDVDPEQYFQTEYGVTHDEFINKYDSDFLLLVLSK